MTNKPKSKPTLCRSTNSLQIIKKATCTKLSPSAKGKLTYHIGHDETAKNLHIRITENTGGGFFSNQWVGVDDVVSTVETLESNDPFKAIIFIPLYQSSSSNNHGFLAAALRAEGILDVVEDQPLSHVLGNVKVFKAAMAKLVKSDTDLHDEVAEEAAIKEAKRAEMIERMKSAGKNSPSKDEPATPRRKVAKRI